MQQEVANRWHRGDTQTQYVDRQTAKSHASGRYEMQVAERAVVHGTKSAVMPSANKTAHKPVPLGHEKMNDMARSNEGGSCQGAPSEGWPRESGLSDGGPRRVGSEEALNECDPELSRSFLVQGRGKPSPPPSPQVRGAQLGFPPPSPQVRGAQLGLPHSR